MLNDGECSQRCPDREIYDRIAREIIPNPDFKLEARPFCVDTCPGEQVIVVF